MTSLEFLVVGDLVPGGTLSENHYSHPLNDIKEYHKDCNFIWANLECSIPFVNTPIKNNSSKVPGNFNSLTEIINGPKFIFSMANNHAMDYGLENLLRTKGQLNGKGINVFGAGRNKSEAEAPFIFSSDGINMGFLAYSSTDKWVGGHLKDEPGKYISLLGEKVFDEVEVISKKVDYLFVALHFGREFIDYPILKDIEFARKIIDKGASAVFGHHPHVYQGYELYNGKPIFYSLGNFLFPSFKTPQKLRWTKKENTGLMIKINLKENMKLNWEIIPIFYNNKLKLVTEILGSKKQKILSRVDKISQPLKLDNKEYAILFNKHLKYVSIKLIFRGVLRNIINPKPKHIVMFIKLIKQYLLGLPAEKNS